MIIIELNEEDIKRLIFEYIQKKLGTVEFQQSAVKILVKSKQNYRAEWENASIKVDAQLEFKAVFETRN